MDHLGGKNPSPRVPRCTEDSSRQMESPNHHWMILIQKKQARHRKSLFLVNSGGAAAA